METNFKFKWKYNPNSIRLENWNYGWDWYYYVTICTKNRENYFWKILEDKIFLNNLWKIAERFWKEIPKHFDNVRLDNYIIMPNHIHWIIIIDNNNTVETRQCLVSTVLDQRKESEKRFQNQWKKLYHQ